MIRTKLFLIILIPISLLLGGVLIFCSHFLVKNSEHQAKQEILQATQNHVQNIRKTLNNVEIQMETMTEIVSDANSPVNRFINELLANNPLYKAIVIAYEPEFLKTLADGKYPEYKLENHSSLLDNSSQPLRYCPSFYLDENGKVATMDLANNCYEERLWFLLGKHTQRKIWLDPFPSDLFHLTVCTCIYPFYYKGEFSGILALFFNLDTIFSDKEFSSLLTSQKYDGHFFIVANNGKIIYDNNHLLDNHYSLYSFMAANDRTNYYPRLDEILSGVSGSFSDKNNFFDPQKKGNKRTWFTYEPIQMGTDATLITTFDEEKVYKTLHRQLVFLWLAGIGTIALLVGILSYFFQSFFKPVNAMILVARQIANGDLQCKIDENQIGKRGELNSLAHVFNQMIEHLRQSIDTIAEETTRQKIYDKEMKTAREIQQSFMPLDYPFFPGHLDFSLDARLVSMKQVAGDFFDFWLPNENTLAFVIADVSGKGIPAALIMIASRTLLRQVAERGNSPGEILTEVNRLLKISNVRMMFITLFFGLYDIRTGELRYSNAGHNPPLFLHRDKTCEWLEKAEDTVLGIFPDIDYHTKTIQLQEGDALCLYTDGITEIPNPEGRLFGGDRLIESIQKLEADVNAHEYVSAIFDDVMKYSEGFQKDDITLLILKRLPHKKN